MTRPEQPDRNEGKDPVDELDGRRQRLEKSLASHRGAGREGKNEGRTGAGYANAVRLSSEFIAGVLAGAGIGWLIDHFAGTSPWGLIVFLLLGFVAGVLNVLRSAGMVAEVGSGGAHKRDADPD